MADSISVTGKHPVKEHTEKKPGMKRVASDNHILSQSPEKVKPEVNPVTNAAEYSASYEGLLGAPLLSSSASLLLDDAESDDDTTTDMEPRRLRMMGSNASMNSEENIFGEAGLPECFQRGSSAYAHLRGDDDHDDDTDDSS